jgi:acetyl esterase
LSPLTLPRAAEHGVGRAVAATPTWANRLLAGRPIRVDGQELHPDAQVLLRAQRLLRLDRDLASIQEERARTSQQARLIRGPTIAVGEVEARAVPGPAGPLKARLYVPPAAPDLGPLAVYLHGGGWCVGGLDTHDQLCRYLCRRSNVRILSVDYRLAPEHPFPAGLDDAIAAFRFAAGTGAAELGAAPDAVAIAGDSAGANLATVACRILRDEGEPQPRFQALIYPPTDLSSKRRSYGLFKEGFHLSEARMDRWDRLYTGDKVALDDPRVSPLLAEDLAGLPPAHVLVAGFDLLRDEVREYARRLAAAGVEVELGEALDLFHAFVNLVGVSPRCREALDPLTDALCAALSR